MKFYVEKLDITGDAKYVEVNTSIVFDKSNEEFIGRRYCNFIITYDEYIALNIRVGDSLKIDIAKLKIDIAKEKSQEVVNTKEMIKEDLIGLRGELYDNLPIGELDSFDLIKMIKNHIKCLDNLIDAIR